MRHMWSGPAGKGLFHRFTTEERCGLCTAACRMRLLTAGLDEIRDAKARTFSYLNESSGISESARF
jgi:hypothetical protein